MTVVVIMPSRGRPKRAHEAIQAVRDTAALIATSVALVVDHDDPAWIDYLDLSWPGPGPEVTTVTLMAADTGNLVKATNTVAMRVARADPQCIIGNLGDDHLCRTHGWDKAIEAALRDPGIAYGDDLIQGEDLPTAPFVRAEIVNALGYYFLPDLDHMYVDNVVRDIAEQAGVRRYLPDVVFEHMHPAVEKAPWDDGYIRVNATEAIHRDRARYQSWREHAMATDIGRVRDVLAAAA